MQSFYKLRAGYPGIEKAAFQTTTIVNSVVMRTKCAAGFIVVLSWFMVDNSKAISGIRCQGLLLEKTMSGSDFQCTQRGEIAILNTTCTLFCPKTYKATYEIFRCTWLGWSPKRSPICEYDGSMTTVIVPAIVGTLATLFIISFCYARLSNRCQRRRGKDDVEAGGAEHGRNKRQHYLKTNPALRIDLAKLHGQEVKEKASDKEGKPYAVDKLSLEQAPSSMTYSARLNSNRNSDSALEMAAAGSSVQRRPSRLRLRRRWQGLKVKKMSKRLTGAKRAMKKKKFTLLARLRRHQQSDRKSYEDDDSCSSDSNGPSFDSASSAHSSSEPNPPAQISPASSSVRTGGNVADALGDNEVGLSAECVLAHKPISKSEKCAADEVEQKNIAFIGDAEQDFHENIDIPSTKTHFDGNNQVSDRNSMRINWKRRYTKSETMRKGVRKGVMDKSSASIVSPFDRYPSANADRQYHDLEHDYRSTGHIFDGRSYHPPSNYIKSYPMKPIQGGKKQRNRSLKFDNVRHDENKSDRQVKKQVNAPITTGGVKYYAIPPDRSEIGRRKPRMKKTKRRLSSKERSGIRNRDIKSDEDTDDVTIKQTAEWARKDDMKRARATKYRRSDQEPRRRARNAKNRSIRQRESENKTRLSEAKRSDHPRLSRRHNA